MRRLRSYIAQAIWGAVLAVLLVIVALDSISDLVEQLSNLKGDYGFVEAVTYVLLYIPSSIYDYLPLSALVGCLIGLGVLASSSELTVMRAAGVTVGQIIWAVMRPVFVFIALGAALGEYVAPYTDQLADSRRAIALGHKNTFRSQRGVWNREGNEYMHFSAVLPSGQLYGISRYIFDSSGSLLEAIFVNEADYQDGDWFERGGQVTRFNNGEVERDSFTSRNWQTEVTPELLNVLVAEPDELPIQRLYTYASYLDKQNQDSSEYWLAFWQKSLQPLATLSLVMIAISFIFGPLRQTTMGFRVFVGVMVGLVFQTSQKLLGPTSIIFGFPPVLAVFAPIAVCFLVGLLLIRRSQ